MDKITIQTYNQMAKKYDEETIEFWENFPKTFLDKFVSLVQNKILNIGSGPGRDGLLLKEKGLKVVCLDASEKMVKMSQERGLESVLGNFLSLPFEDNSFHGVWAYTSLLHIPKKDIPKALSEIKRVLKRNGILGLGMIEGNKEEYRESSGINKLRWFSFYSKEEIEKLLEKHGFEILYFKKYQPRTKNYLNFVAKKLPTI